MISPNQLCTSCDFMLYSCDGYFAHPFVKWMILPVGTAPHGGGQFGQLSHSLDNMGDSPYPSLIYIELSLFPISNSEDRYGPSCVRVPARGLPPALSGEARASLLVPSSAFLLTRKGQAHHAPSSAEAPLPRRLPPLSPLLPQPVCC